MIFLPKGTPEEIVAAWRDAAARTISAPDFEEKSRLVLGTYPQATGDAAVTRMKLAVDVAPQAKQFVKDWLTEKYNVKL